MFIHTPVLIHLMINNIYADPQGTAYVLDPNNGDSFDIIARLEPNDWAFGADI